MGTGLQSTNWFSRRILRGNPVRPGDAEVTSEVTSPAQVLADLKLPFSLSLDELISRVEIYCEKPLKLVPVSGDGWGRTTGLWIDLEEEGLIFYRLSDAKPYQQHSICHELGHILLRHQGCTELNGEMGKNMFQFLGQRRGVKKLLARGHESNELESAAESVAFLLAERLNLGEDKKNFDEVFGA